MTAKSRAALTAQFDVIRNETVAGANTRARIADAHQDALDSVLAVMSPEGIRGLGARAADTYLVQLNGSYVPFAWDATSTAIDDGQTCLQVTGVATGRYLRKAKAYTRVNAYDDLVSRIYSVAALKILDVYIGDNITDASNITSWPGTVPGGTALAHAGAASNFTVGTDARTGRKCAVSTSAADRALIRSTGVVKDAIVVYRMYGTSTGAANYFLCSVSGGNYPLQANAGVDQWAGASAGSWAHYLDGRPCDSMPNDRQMHVCEGVLSGNTTAGLKAGGFNGFAFSTQGEIYAVLAFTDVLTATERAEIVSALSDYYDITSPVGLFCDGNSLVTGHPTNYDWPRIIQIPNVLTWKVAVAGQTLADVSAGLAANFASKSYSGLRDNIYFLYEDVNSLYHGMTATQVLDYNWSIAASARAAGMKVILSTCMPADLTLDATAEAYRQTVNTQKRLLWNQHADYLIDWAALPQFSDSTNSTIFSDHLHLTDYGYWLMHAELSKAVARLVY